MFKRFYEKKGRSAKAGGHQELFLDGSAKGETDYTWGAAVDRAQREGRIKPDDPRCKISPEQVKSFSEMSLDEIFAVVDKTVAEGRSNRTLSPREKVLYAAMDQSGRELVDRIVENNPVENGKNLSVMAERSGMALHKENPDSEAAMTLLAISAATHDNVRGARDLEGFTNNSISEAASSQGKTWLQARDALVAHGALNEDDPRRSVRAADVAEAKQNKRVSDIAFGMMCEGKTVPLADRTKASFLERQTMLKHKDPAMQDHVTASLAVSAALTERAREKEAARAGAGAERS